MEKKIKGIKKFFEEFKKFITRGNVLDMAVGVIVGGAFTSIVNGLSNNILKPLINWLIAALLGKDGLSGAITMLSPAYKDVLSAEGVVIGQELDLAASIYIDWGAFVSAVINFFLIAFVLFTIVRVMNRVAEARDKIEEEQTKEYKKFKAIKKISKTQKISRAKAAILYEEQCKVEAEKKAEEARIAEEKAKEEARIAEEKATANTRLLEEIRDLLKSK